MRPTWLKVGMPVDVKLKTVPASRIAYLDALRIIAVHVMIMTHVAATCWYFLDVNTFEWLVHNVYHSIASWSVPMFVMISGVNLLDPDRSYTVRGLLTKKVLRMILLFVLWCGIYAGARGAYAFWNDWRQLGAIQPETVQRIAGYFWEGNYHLWFLPMIAALYLLTPLLRPVCRDDGLMRYFLVIALLFSTVLPALDRLPFLRAAGSMTYMRVAAYLSFGFTLYFVLGRYLHTHPPAPRVRYAIYCAGCAAMLASVFSDANASKVAGRPTSTFDLFSFYVLLPCVAAFLFTQSMMQRYPPTEKAKTRLCAAANDIFGIYLVHDMFLILFRKLDLY